MWVEIDESEQGAMNVALGGIPEGIAFGNFKELKADEDFIHKTQWAWKLDSVYLGEDDLAKNDDVSYALFDQNEFNQSILLPHNVWIIFTFMAVDKVPALDCTMGNYCYSAQSCDEIGLENLDKMTFKVGADHFVLQPSALSSSGDNYCYLHVGDAGSNYDQGVYVFGWQFFLNYVVSFDFGKNTIKVAPTLYGATVGTQVNHQIGWFAVLLMMISFFAIGFVLAYLIGCLTRCRTKKNQQ